MKMRRWALPAAFWCATAGSAAAQGWSPPRLPDDVIAKTREKYIEAYEKLTGRPFAWK